ncbi:MAG: helix-turn-helix domain-containing protein [Planctomycetales bacterium]|nr:helix-turn-helix domain-containing protein [Planctomycetales bacterium]
MPEASQLFRVGLVLQTGQAHMRGVSRGVFRFLRSNPHWRIQGAGQYPLLQWDDLSAWEGDGLIAIPNSHAQLDALLEKQVPIVNAGSRFREPQMTNVACDSEAIGRVAASHLLNCGLKHFLFVGELGWENEVRRYTAFSNFVAAAGCKCELLSLPMNEGLAPDGSARYSPDMSIISKGLSRVAKPVGVCAPNSALARFIVEEAVRCGLNVPDQVAAVGVNDDPLLCESTNPHLSAVVQPSERIGLESAKQLDALMSGTSQQYQDILLPPVGIVRRRSTDMLAIDDANVRAGVRFIREHSHDPIDMVDVARAAGVSRRSLETKFQREIGRTPAAELRRVRIETAKRLLAETADPITSVVFAAGFNSRQAFSNLFRRETGLTPSEFRKQFLLETLA